MKMKNLLSILTALGTLGAPMLVQAQGAYDYESFNYPGSTYDQVFGINNRGDAVGNGTVNLDGFPFVYDSKKGEFTNIAPLAGYDNTAVLGISDKGVLVGSVTNFGPNSPIDDESSGLIIDKNGAITLFDHPNALLFTQARGVNNKGLVTGFRDEPSPLFGTSIFAFLHDPKSNTFADIIPQGDHLQSIAQGINSKGEVVGSAFFLDGDNPCNPANIGFVRYGWLRAQDGTVTYFQINGDRTAARGISDSGTIVGFARDPADGRFKGFKVELDGSQCQAITIATGDLLEPPGAVATFAQGIKNSGEVVGSYDDGTTSFSFIARPQ